MCDLMAMLTIVRPHRLYYICRMGPIVTDRVTWSVCRSVTVVSPAKMAEPIKMLFRLRTRVGPRNRILDGVQIPFHERGNFEEEKGGSIANVGTLCGHLCKNG